MKGRAGKVAKDYYSPKEVVFNRETALWVMQNLESLKAGSWPTDVSGYIDLGPIGKRSRSNQAVFVTPAEGYVEITERLERCGIDGLILMAMECWGET